MLSQVGMAEGIAVVGTLALANATYSLLFKKDASKVWAVCKLGMGVGLCLYGASMAIDGSLLAEAALKAHEAVKEYMPTVVTKQFHQATETMAEILESSGFNGTVGNLTKSASDFLESSGFNGAVGNLTTTVSTNVNLFTEKVGEFVEGLKTQTV